MITYETCYSFKERATIVHALESIASYVKDTMAKTIRSGESVTVSIENIQNEGSGYSNVIHVTVNSKGEILVGYGYCDSYILNGEADPVLKIERLMDFPEFGVDLILMWDRIVESLEKSISARAAKIERLMNFKLHNSILSLDDNSII